MIVNHEARFLFVHVQKTGGLSVQDHLLANVPGSTPLRDVRGGLHATLPDALTAHPELSDYFVFGFVRNPWARLYSWHAMVLRRGEVARQEGREVLAQVIATKPFWSGVLERYPDFEAFVLEGTQEFTRLRLPQSDYLSSSTKSADFIGRTEDLEDDLIAACRLMSSPEPLALDHKNSGPSSDYRGHYSSAMIERVTELFARDVDRFGYSF